MTAPDWSSQVICTCNEQCSTSRSRLHFTKHRPRIPIIVGERFGHMSLKQRRGALPQRANREIWAMPMIDAVAVASP